LIIVGPSGVGKNTLKQEILKKYGGLFESKISYTTRHLKGYEKKQDSYYFISREEFKKVGLSLLVYSILIAHGEG
jgi:guanylate kinase